MTRIPRPASGPKPVGARATLAGAVAAALVAALAVIAPAPTAAAASPAAMSCTAEAFSVTVGGLVTTMTGQFCSRGSPAGKALIYTMPGATYKDIYWNFPVNPAVNNFTLSATLAGFAVLNLNELGTPPESSYLPAADLTVANNASALHQVIADMSASYPRALLFGHSFGSIIAVTENVTYHDPAVLGMTLQGFLHTEYAPGIAQVLASLEPAQDDPALAGYGLPAGYLTTVPADREADFGSAGDESAAVAAEDAATEVATSGSLLSGQAPAESPALTQAVTVRVNLVVGQHDNLFCGPSGCPTLAAVYAAEKDDYGPAAHLTVFVLPGAGHSVNLADDAPLATVQELLWAEAAL